MKLQTLEKCTLCESRQISAADAQNNIYICNSCGFIFDNPRPVQDEIINFYSANDKYDDWLEAEKVRDSLWKRRLKLVEKYRDSGTLLDIGTGIGQFLFFARKDFEVKGTEISESAAAAARQKYGIDVIHGDIVEISFASKFDVITLFHVLEHVPDPAATLRRCRELLNSGGILILAVPNDNAGLKKMVIRVLSILKIGKFRSYGKLGLPKLELDGSQKEIHLSHFKNSVLVNFLERNGFSVIEDTLDPYYSVDGFNKILHDLFFFLSLVIKRLFRKNIYPAIWIAAKKNHTES